MGFFDKREFRKPGPPDRPATPEWFGPADGVLPGVSSQRAVLIKTSENAVVAHHFAAFPNGITFELLALLRTRPGGHFPWEIEYNESPETWPDDWPDDFMRFGIRFSDGSTWTNMDGPGLRDMNTPPKAPFLSGQGGGGGGGQWHQSFWMWPLPPAGPLTFVVEWPSEGIEETSRAIDATELRQRAKEAEEIWSVP